MDLENFHQEFIETVRARAESTKDFIRAAFIDECGERLLDAEELYAFENCRYEGFNASKKKIRVDGYSYDDADNSLALIVADFENDDDLVGFVALDVTDALDQVRLYLEAALNGELTDGSVDESHPGYGLACDLMDWQLKISKYKLYFVSDRFSKSKKKNWVDRDINGVPVEFHIWDVVRFHSAYISATGRDELLVDFCTAESLGLPFLAAVQSGGDYDAYLCMISGDLLADIYDKYGSRLLEGNVRTFLSTKGKVNSAIQNTIRNRPEMFFAFNNGIAATAENLIIQETSAGPRITNVTNLQIVNGGQTTASLAYAKRGALGRKDFADLSEVMVQMKLSILPSERVGLLTPEIARYANSQNKVSDADFFSNHPYHVRLEEFSRRIFTSPSGGAQHGTHWFYERARGQFSNEQAKLTAAQKSQFLIQNPKAQLFNKTDVAKYENSWREMPHKVSMGAQKNFLIFADVISKAWASDGKIYNEDYFRSLVALSILFKRIEALVSQQPWYQGGYRANIVTYTVAKLHNMISEHALGKQLNLRIIWDLQRTPDWLVSQVTIIARAVFDVLTDPDRPKDNVTEWAKMQACWEQVKEFNIPIQPELHEKLTDLSFAVYDSKTSRRTQKTDDGIEVQIKVFEVPSVEWNRMLNWGVKHDHLTPKQVSLLKVVSLTSQKLPTERQCIEIWRIRDDMISKGFIAM
ncbi:AIPR family protein [Pseudomonas viridiflava]|uniref:AIPR family protein n=1 Tax=Pseudomonas viridiflava TaxID=33069 RepID=UPI000F088CB8|nr:AIPR family protein [Pseudomonas viridiflava]